MLKKSSFAILLLALVLAACTPLATPSRMGSTPTSELQLQPQPTAALATSQITSGDNNANCTVVGSVLPTPNPTDAAQQTLFKPVSASDHILGSNEASITFLEYSDYQ